MIYPKAKDVSFREEVKSIEKTTYLTHSLYYYPAKFIPQIVRFCLNEYSKKNGIVLDPFAGSGTTGVEASTQEHESYMLDINPLLEYFYPLKMPSFTKEEWNKYFNESKIFLEEVLSVKPKKVKKINENLKYWYPTILYEYFCNIWTNFHKLKKNKNKISIYVTALVLFKISKYYSYAEHSMPKLFISKRKRIFIEKKIKEGTLFEQIKKMGLKNIEDIKKAIDNILELNIKLEKANYIAGVDSSNFDYDKIPKYNCIITSPPYLQAQEYIRTFKLEMMWLGIPQKKINNYMSKEIPYRKCAFKIHGEYIDENRKKIENKNLLKLYDSYFWFMIKTLKNASKNLEKNGKICVLIGNPKMDGIEVEIWKVIYEYFVKKLNYKFIELYEDKIVTRKLFSGRNNKNPEGMKSEYLLVLEKK